MSRAGRTSGAAGLALLIGLGMTGCTGGVPVPGAPPSSSATTGETSATSAKPSITREVPPELRVPLGGLPAQRVCDLVTPADLERLAFPVNAGRPRQAGDPPLAGCEFPARAGKRSIVLASQPAGFGSLGGTEVKLGTVVGTQELHGGDCTVYAPVSAATLQVSVVTDEPDEETCQHAAGIAQYLLVGLIT